jgi:hypothetical protein
MQQLVAAAAAVASRQAICPPMLLHGMVLLLQKHCSLCLSKPQPNTTAAAASTAVAIRIS